MHVCTYVRMYVRKYVFGAKYGHVFKQIDMGECMDTRFP